MEPLLVIYFTDKLELLTTNDPTHLIHFDSETGEMIEETISNQLAGLPRVRGFTPGGAIFSAQSVQKFDRTHNALYFKPGWQLTIESSWIRIDFSNGDRSKMSTEKIAVLKVVFAQSVGEVSD